MTTHVETGSARETGDASATGRANQKRRTRAAIVAAGRELIGSGRYITMGDVARCALVSEATAYRYFPDLGSLLAEAMAGLWRDPVDVLQPVADSTDPIERVAFAADHLLRHVLAYQGAVRAMIATTINRPGAAAIRPGLRFGLIDEALDPISATLAFVEADGLAQLKRDLAIVVSAEALFVLTDLYRLDPDAAITSAVRTATTLVRAALR